MQSTCSQNARLGIHAEDGKAGSHGFMQMGCQLEEAKEVVNPFISWVDRLNSVYSKSIISSLTHPQYLRM